MGRILTILPLRRLVSIPAISRGMSSKLNSVQLVTRLFAAEVVTSGALPSSAMPEQWIAWKELR
jgi:hypothetical protein